FTVTVAVVQWATSGRRLSLVGHREVEDALGVPVGDFLALLAGGGAGCFGGLRLACRPSRFGVRIVGLPEDVVDADQVDRLLAEPERLVDCTDGELTVEDL